MSHSSLLMCIYFDNKGALLFTLLVYAVIAKRQVKCDSNCIGWLKIKADVCVRDSIRND
jgi:hypothetical protein